VSRQRRQSRKGEFNRFNPSGRDENIKGNDNTELERPGYNHLDVTRRFLELGTFEAKPCSNIISYGLLGLVGSEFFRDAILSLLKNK
jgi:hypothetical protein